MSPKLVLTLVLALVLLPHETSGAAEVPNAPSWIAVTAVSAAWTAIDGYTTVAFLRHADPHARWTPCMQEGWSAWEYGKRPTATRVAGAMAVEFAGSEAIAFLLRRAKRIRQMWWVPEVGNAGVHLAGAVWNLRHC